MANDQMLGASKTPSTVLHVDPSATEKLTCVPARRSARPARVATSDNSALQLPVAAAGIVLTQ